MKPLCFVMPQTPGRYPYFDCNEGGSDKEKRYRNKSRGWYQYDLPEMLTLLRGFDELRTSDVRRYNGTPFTLASVKRFTPDEHTLLLYHFDGDTIHGRPGGEVREQERTPFRGLSQYRSGLAPHYPVCQTLPVAGGAFLRENFDSINVSAIEKLLLNVSPTPYFSGGYFNSGNRTTRV